MKHGTILATLLLLAAAVVPAQTGSTDSPDILILNSYHRGYLWTDQQSDAMLATLTRELPKARIDVQYMDWKRYPAQATLDICQQVLAHHYAQAKPDIILTTDDAALLFALQHRQDLFGPVPVVFAGIFQTTGEKLMQTHERLTGVFEAVDLDGTIRVATGLLPAVRQAVIIHDSSETSLTMEQDLRESLARTAPGLGIKILTGVPFRELQDQIQALDQSSFILLASYARDSAGLVKQPEEFAALMDQVSPVPIFTFYEHMMGQGLVGGSLLSGSLQGEAAARLAVRILQDRNQAVPGAVYDKTVHYGFDWLQLQKYGLQNRPLPEGSSVLHKPFNFFEAYRALVISVLVVFLVLVVLVIFLVINIRQRSRTEVKLRETNTALELSQERYRQINEELEERVRQRTNDLEQSIIHLNLAREQLVQREKLAALGNLVAGVAHELNTPIGSAVTMASSLQERLLEAGKGADPAAALPKATQQFMDWARTGTDLLLRTLQKAADLITSFKQIAVDRSNIQRRRFNVQEIASHEVSVLQVDARRYQASITLQIDPAIEMEGYPGILGQILDNLVRNALIHGLGQKPGGAIEISAALLGSDMLRLEVRDNGTGIAAEHQARVFEPFFTTALGQGGSGLGLHIVYNLTLSLGGNVSLAGTGPEGTTFRVDLPLVSPEVLA